MQKGEGCGRSGAADERPQEGSAERKDKVSTKRGQVGRNVGWERQRSARPRAMQPCLCEW